MYHLLILRCILAQFMFSKLVTTSILCGICEKDQQDTHLFLIIYFTSIILDMFRTSNCSSSGGLYEQLTIFYHASLWGAQSLTRYDLIFWWWTIICLKHVEDNLNEINYYKNVCILLVFLTYVYHDAWFRDIKVCVVYAIFRNGRENVFRCLATAALSLLYMKLKSSFPIKLHYKFVTRIRGKHCAFV